MYDKNQQSLRSENISGGCGGMTSQLANKWQDMSGFLTTREETKSNKHRQHVAHAEDVIQDVGSP